MNEYTARCLPRLPQPTLQPQPRRSTLSGRWLCKTTKSTRRRNGFGKMMEYYPRLHSVNLKAEMKFGDHAGEDDKGSYLGFRFFGIADPDGWRNQGYSFSDKIMARQLLYANFQSTTQRSCRSFHGYQQDHKFVLVMCLEPTC
jgi:hypothetical protein